MARYRTPRKKTTNWKSLLGATALGLALVALGVLLLVSLPEQVPGQGLTVPGLTSPPAETDTAGETGESEEGEESPDRRTPTATESRIGGAVLGVALIIMGVLVPVGTVVIEKTSGKAWSRRARKKHPWKRKI